VWCWHESGSDAATLGGRAGPDKTVATALGDGGFVEVHTSEEANAPRMCGVNDGVLGVAWYRFRATFGRRWGRSMPSPSRPFLSDR
jgi:hypothetical protein